VVLLQEERRSKQRRAPLARRDAWLVRNVDGRCWSGTGSMPGSVACSVARDRLGDDVWVIDPGELV
jgi:hypothetical protein